MLPSCRRGWDRDLEVMRSMVGNRVRRCLLFGLALWLLVGQGEAFAYVTDGNVYTPPSYLSFLPPDSGGSYRDATFGTSVKRISEAPNQPNAADSGNLPFIINEYSTMSPFNADNSKLLLIHQSYFALYDGGGTFIRDLPLEIHALSEPRWSRRDPSVLYYIKGNALKQYNDATGLMAVVRVFTEYTKISGLGESDISLDGNHFVLVGDNRYVFVYEISTDTKGSMLDTTGVGGFDQVLITPSNSVLVGWYGIGSDRFQGVELYDRDLKFLRQVSRAIGHMDVTRDMSGDEILLVANAADPLPVCANGVVKIRLADGERSCLISFDWSLAVHVSAVDQGGWAIISTYAPGDPEPLGGWTKYTNEILQVKLDGSEVRRLAHHRSRPFNGYIWTPRAAASRDGSRVVYSSNYGLQSILGYPSEYSDVYLLMTRFEEEDPGVGCHPCPWFTNGLPQHSGGSAFLTMEPGAQVSFTFTGIEARWIGYRDEWSGIANVYVDGALQATVDTFGSPARSQAVLFSVSGLAPESHVLVIEVTGAGRSGSGGSWVWVDAFEVVSAAGGVARVEQDDPPVRCFPCAWLPNALAQHSGGRAILAMDAGAQVSFIFTGMGASWIGYRDEWSGIARVFVDGIFSAEVDTYASPPSGQDVLYTVSGLPPGTHILTVEVTGRQNPVSGGAWVWADAFEVSP